MAVELLNIDCYDKLKTMEAGTVDLFLQDTPFGVTQNEWDVAPDLEKMWPEWLRVGKLNTAYIFFATQPFATDLINSNRKMFKYDLIWQKSQETGFLNANKMPLREHEIILVFYKSLPTYNPVLTLKPKQNIRPIRKQKLQNRTSTNYGKYNEDDFRTVSNKLKYPSSILYEENEQGIKHPTVKPLDLIKYLIKSYSNEGDLVYDGYGGSGTTAVAAELEGRNAIVCETNKDYYDAACKRFKAQTMQQDLFKQAL